MCVCVGVQHLYLGNAVLGVCDVLLKIIAVALDSRDQSNMQPRSVERQVTRLI